VTEEGLSKDGFGSPSLVYFQEASGYKPNPITCLLGTDLKQFTTNDTDDEAHLDTQMLTGMANGVKTCFYLMPLANGWMYEFAGYVFSTEGAPLIVSMSSCGFEDQQCVNMTEYGADNCSAIHIPNWEVYVNRTNTEFKKLGLLGHTLLAASGDDGTIGCHPYENPDGCSKMGPMFPATSPYLLAVGATSVEVSTGSHTVDSNSLPPICTNTGQYQCPCSTSMNEKIALNNNTAEFDTGGGFSFIFPQPSYQTQAVTDYIKSGVTLPPPNVWNANNRGYPDIAAVGENLCVLDVDSSCELSGGTSGSTPIMAGIIALLNNDRISNNKSPLGFINPLIYQMFYADPSKYFNNQLGGGNNAGECDSSMGFNAVNGLWNPLVGVGSPKFSAIREYVANLK